jgi:hypothetical protein
VVREGWRQGGEMTQALYAHMNNKIIKNKINKKKKRYLFSNVSIFIPLWKTKFLKQRVAYFASVES